MADAYPRLRKRVVAAGLLRRSHAYYAWRASLSFAILIAGFAITFIAPAVAVVVIAFGSIQVALIGHDAGHMAVFGSKRANTALGGLCWTVALGISFEYWNDRHNRHHATPNHVGLDPDVRWDFGPLLTPLLAFTFRIEGWRFALRELHGKARAAELVLLSISAVAYLMPLAIFGVAWLVTLLLSQVLASLYLAAVVAPNHIGMPLWSADADRSVPFLERQVLSSRNVSPGLVADFVFGGLNYQIEHHLFTSMPRNHFAAARELVKAFCAEYGLPYAESGVVSVYRAIWSDLPRMGRLELT